MNKPDFEPGIGIDALPATIRGSRILDTGDLFLLAGASVLPDIDPSFDDSRLRSIFQYYSVNPEEMEKELHLYARELLRQGKIREAWQVLLALN